MEQKVAKMAIESTINSLKAYQSGISLPLHGAGKSAGQGDDKHRYEDPISKKLKEESRPLTDGSEVVLFGGTPTQDLPQTAGASAKKAVNAYETTAKRADTELAPPKVDDMPPYAKAARQIREAQQERAEELAEDRAEKESRVLEIIKERMRKGELPRE